MRKEWEYLWNSVHPIERAIGSGSPSTVMLLVHSSYAEEIVPASLEPSFTIPHPPPTQSFLDLLNTYVEHAYSVFDRVRFSISHPSLHKQPYKALLDTFDLAASESSSIFTQELEELVNAVEESTKAEQEDTLFVFALDGLSRIEEEHGRNSDVYEAAAQALKGLLSHKSLTSRKLALLVIPSEPRLTARSDSAARQFNERSIPLVHSKSQCFSSEEVCTNSTYSCSSRGECIKATRAGKTCFSCSCYSTKDDAGRTVDWAGQMCEREDISVPFTILAGSTIFLIAIVIGSISLLYSIGEATLPGTLTVTSGGGHLKRD